jgi:hypothetical protein
MWTGRQTMASIDDAIDKLRSEESQRDSALSSATQQAERLRRDRGGALRELARVKLDEMAAGRLVSGLDAVERRAMQMLEDMRHRLVALNERMTAGRNEVAQATSEREAAAHAVEQALADVEALRLAAEAKVRETAAWRAVQDDVQAADTIAKAAEDKASRSEAELAEKRKPYDTDPLFSYLWGRKFGTSEYHAGAIVRMLDVTVADFVGFSGARANYAMLTEIPVRLREHALARRGVVDEIKVRLAAIERQAMIEAGIEAREAALVAARHALAKTEATLATRQKAMTDMEAERASLLDTSDASPYVQAIALLAEADSHDDIAQLRAEARRTATQADEQIVRRLEDIAVSIGKADAEIVDLRKTVRDAASRRAEVERTRDRFRASGYDHPHATFGNETDISRVLQDILSGVVRSGILWDVLRGGFNYRRPRGTPDFGSPTFPFPFPIPGGSGRTASGGEWRNPSSEGDWRPGGDRSDSGRNDGFTTGGSF